MINSVKSVAPRLTIRKAAAATSAPISTAALIAPVATSSTSIARPQSPTLTAVSIPRKCGLPRAMPVPHSRSISPDSTLDAYGHSKVVSRTPRIPADATLNFLANFDIRYMLPGVGAGAGGENERTMSFALLHDRLADKMLIQMSVTGTFLTVQDPDRFTVRDLIHTFFRNKPLTLCNMPQEQLSTIIADLVQVPSSLNWSLRAY